MEIQDPLERRIGTVLKGKWTLDRLLGKGGMAAVYAATHRIGRQDAIKILHPEIAASADFRARFEREARAANRFRHAGAVEIRDIDVADDGAPFLVMELLRGESLATRAERLGGIPLGELLTHAHATLDVLAAAHARGIIHRDIKPDNLFVLEDDRLKVLDFGVARIGDGAGGTFRTRAGALIGTLTFMAPEQISGKPIDGRVDVFALGAVMFRLIARRRLHEARTEAEMIVKMATEPAPALASVAPDVPPNVALIVDRALAFAREDRYPDAAAMQRDIEAVRGGKSPPAPSVKRIATVANATAATVFEQRASPPPAAPAPAIPHEPTVAAPTASASSQRSLGGAPASEAAPEVHPSSSRKLAALIALSIVVPIGFVVWLLLRGAPTAAEIPPKPSAAAAATPPSRGDARDWLREREREREKARERDKE
jgi:serine/threonine-protein kinase